MKMKRKILAMAALVAITASCAQEEEVVVAGADYEPGVAEVADVEYDPVDADAGLIGTQGLAEPDPAAGAVSFVAWDANRDSMIDTNEFNAGFNQGNWFHDWDIDNDGALTETEFQTVNAGWGDAPVGVDEAGMFDAWDADEDGLVDNDEFSTGVYSTWDRDSSQLIDTTEYDAGVNWFGWN